MTRRLSTTLLILSTAFIAIHAQTGDTGYQFLQVPTSAHSAALGGVNVSIIEDDPTLMFTNPALLANVSDKTLNLNFTSYISSTSKLSAAFAKQAGERGTWAVAAMLLNYGTMTETNENFEELGEFSAKDISVQGGYTYLFSDRWSGGVQGKVIMSNYGEFKSTALGVDLGINYYDVDHGLSFSLVGQNLGGQVKALYEKNEKLPFNLVAGISKDLANAPIRLSLTFDNITDWDEKKPINHLTFGADIFPSSTTWVAVGYNPRRGNEMKIGDSKHWAGLSLGAGLTLKKLKVGLAWGKYHVAASSLIINTSYAF
ncbi:MAG: type IX secretion system protein PorQ [Bacteroidaceae bacterium]|nr:type IX secretion system protein PorQ [Bacteroidaceae bacterium]